MSFASSNAGHSSGGDYKVVALDAKPQPGKLTEFVPEVERTKRRLLLDFKHAYVYIAGSESYLVSSLGGNNASPPPDAAVVRNWELSDEEQQQNPFKGYTNNNEKKVSKSFFRLNKIPRVRTCNPSSVKIDSLVYLFISYASCFSGER